MMKACPLCNTSESRAYIQCSDNLVTGTIFTIEECLACGFLFTSDEPGKENIGEYYASDSYEALTGKRSALRSLIRSLRQRHVARIIENRRQGTKGTLIDIGCGAGDFLLLMKKRGWLVRGIEPDESCRKNLATRGINVITPDDITTIPDASADVITLWHVLEHVHDLLEFGGHLKRILAPGGICIIAVPNATSFDGRVYGKYWHGYELPRHLYHFTAETLSRFAHMSNFTILQLGAMPLDSLYGCLKSEEYRHGNALRGLIVASISIALSQLRTSSSPTIFAILKHAE